MSVSSKIAVAFEPHRSEEWLHYFAEHDWKMLGDVELVPTVSAEDLFLLKPNIVVGNQSSFILDYLQTAHSIPIWIHFMGVGVDRAIDTIRALPKRPRVSNGRGLHNASISEYVIGMILFFEHRIAIWLNQAAGATYTPTHSGLAQGKTILIFGTGSIGQAVATRCKALGLTVFGVDKSGRPKKDFDEVIKLISIPELLPKADYIVVCFPLTNETRDLFDERMFAMCKTGAVFVNVARGHIVVENDLVKAVQSRKLGGAALDVFREEPLPQDSLLWGTDNIIITPHISAKYEGYQRDAVKLFRKNLISFLVNQSLVTEVDLRNDIS